MRDLADDQYRVRSLRIPESPFDGPYERPFEAGFPNIRSGASGHVTGYEESVAEYAGSNERACNWRHD